MTEYLRDLILDSKNPPQSECSKYLSTELRKDEGRANMAIFRKAIAVLAGGLRLLDSKYARISENHKVSQEGA